MIKSKDEADVAARVIDRTTESAQVSIRYSTINPAASEPGVERDRRAKPRYGVSLSVTLFGDHNFYIGLSENLSEGGLFVQTQTTLPIGTTIQIEFTLPGSSAAFSVVGEVRWIRSANAVREDYNNFGSGGDEASKPGLGIQFKELTPETAAAITKFIRLRDPDFYTE